MYVKGGIAGSGLVLRAKAEPMTLVDFGKKKVIHITSQSGFKLGTLYIMSVVPSLFSTRVRFMEYNFFSDEVDWMVSE